MVKAGNYPVVSTHIELFRSNKSPSNKLTQVSCCVSGYAFFRAIKPRGLESYLDNYKLGGDLLKALNMTREDDGTFLYRCQFEIVDDDDKIFFVDERKALKELLDFLQNFPGCVILGVDEDSVAILVKKLKEVNRDKFKELVVGFTYWKRVLKYNDVAGYGSLDLEEYFAQTFQEDLSSFSISGVLLKSVLEVSTTRPLLYKLCKRIGCLEKAINLEYDRKANVENVEVYSSFRPFVSATFSAEMLEQVIVSSESDSEPEETGRSGFSKPEETTRSISSLPAEVRDTDLPIDEAVFKNYTDGTKAKPKPPPQLARKLPEMLTKETFWERGRKGRRIGTVECPNLNCNNQVNFCNIENHLKKVHKAKVTSLSCEKCKCLVAPSALATHFPLCDEDVPNGPSQDPNVLPHLGSYRYRCLTDADVPSGSPQHDNGPPQSSIITTNLNPNNFKEHPEVTILDGLSVVEDYYGNFRSQDLLIHYIKSKINISSICNCKWMFSDYQKFIQNLGEVKILSPTEFLYAVKEVCFAMWKIDVGPFKDGTSVLVRPGMCWNGLFFKGLKTFFC
eukprot:GFUD01006478.1.p1 GENE.GFUD01006478.1~~GFUD01006478.1.p1  ORF type:complete len:613 (-),score=116.47 GFUD01006478.1:6-1694(-)